MELQGILLIVGLLVLLASGMPLGFAFALLGTVFVFFLRGEPGLAQIGFIIWTTVRSEVLLSVPLFVVMGELLFAGGLGADLFEVTSRWLGRIPGGLAVASLASCCLFGTVCGSSTVATATVGRVAYPEMTKRGYDKVFTAGVLSTGGGIAILIPPSIGMIIYAELTDQSVGQMFMAGVIPGLLLTILPATYCFLYALLNPRKVPRMPPSSWKDRIVSLRKLWTVTVLIVAVLGALYTGVVTPNEAGAVGALVAFLIIWLYRRTPSSEIWGAVMASIRTMAFIGMILIGANIMNYAISWTGIPVAIIAFLTSAAVPAWAVVPLICAAFFLMGMFMNTMAVMLLIVPAFVPVMKTLGIDPVWIGVIMMLNIEIATITPPVGQSFFVISEIAHLPVEKLMQTIWPWVAADLVSLALVLLFPALATWLPSTMRV